MSIQNTNPNNPLEGGLDGLKQQAIDTAENKISAEVSKKLDNPVADQLIKNKDTITQVVKTQFSGQQDLPSNSAFDRMKLNDPEEMAKRSTTKTFKEFIADKQSPIVYCTLSIDGKDFLDKSSFTMDLEQKTNDHDSFSITVGDDALDSFEGYVMENSKNILGKKLSINLHRFGVVQQVFTGIIAKVRNKKENGYGKLHIDGYSPSILLENGQDCQSYESKTLEQIIKEATAEYPEDAKVKVEQCNTTYPVPYTVQYKESDYQFIKRLALRYGEYFYYNGQQLVFGNKVEPIVELSENKDLINVEFELNIKPQEFNYISYDSISAEAKEKDSGSVQVQYKENPFQTIAVNASKQVFKKKPDMLFNGTSHQNVERDLNEMVKRQKESRQHVMLVNGKSKDPSIRIGGRVKLSDINGKAMETYRILEIHHFYEGSAYYNEFIGIPDIFISPYFNEDAFPECEEQSATVTDNDNPQGMIKVQFPWQKKKGLKTPWLRVVTPYAGKGKGMHIIPEVDEEVIIGFDNGNAERPFVFGAMFNGEASAGLGGKGNFMKGLQTPTGSRLHMNDKDGSLHMQDNGGVSMKFDGGGNATTSAKSTHNINAGSSHTTGVGGKKNSPPQSLLHMDASGNIILDSKTSITIKVGGNSITISKEGIVTTVGEGKIESTATAGSVSIKSTSADATFSGVTKTNVGGGTTTYVTGTDVEINQS